jgi:hypothetical protein
MAEQSNRTTTRARQSREPIFDDMTKQSVPTSPVADAPTRTARAKNYEQKITELLNYGMRVTAEIPATVADSAAIIVHGPAVASKMGDLADQDPRVRRAVDFITSGTDNPYAALVVATLPLVAQIIRNHETEAPVRVGLRIPFTQRTFKVPFKLRLKNPFLRSITTAPDDLTAGVFANPAIIAAMAEQKIEVAWNGMAGK